MRLPFALALALATLTCAGGLAQSDTLYLRDGSQEAVRVEGLDERGIRVSDASGAGGDSRAEVRRYANAEVAYLRRADGSAVAFAAARRVDLSAELIAATDELRCERGFATRRFYGAGGRQLPKRTFEALLSLDDAAMARYRNAEVERTIGLIAAGTGGFLLGRAAVRQVRGDTEGARAGTPGAFVTGAGLVLGGLVLDRLASRHLRAALTLYTARRQTAYGTAVTVGPGALVLTF